VVVSAFIPGSDVKVHIKDPIQLRTPNGDTRNSHIAGFERASGPNVDRTKTAIVLPPDTSKQDVHRGTEMWLLTAPEEETEEP